MCVCVCDSKHSLLLSPTQEANFGLGWEEFRCCILATRAGRQPSTRSAARELMRVSPPPPSPGNNSEPVAQFSFGFFFVFWWDSGLELTVNEETRFLSLESDQFN